MIRYSFWSLAVLVLASATSWGHGPELDYAGGQITVDSADQLSDGTPLYAEDLNLGFANLGWQVLPVGLGGGHLVPGDQIGLEILDIGSIIGLAGPLPFYFLFHDGAGLADPGTHHLDILGTVVSISQHSATSTSTSIGEVFAADDFHDHLGFLLNSTTPAGAYFLAVRNTTSNTAVAPSDPYFLLLNNGLGATQYAQALADFDDLVTVPEVSSTVLVGLAGLGLLLGRRFARRA